MAVSFPHVRFRLKKSLAASKHGLAVFGKFLEFLTFYMQRKVVRYSYRFEAGKNRIVKFLMMKRGRYNRPFLHVAAMTLIGIGVLIAPYLADTYPVFSPQNSFTQRIAAAEPERQSVIAGEDVFQTAVSQKPRDKIITYTVQTGDTLSSVARKFGITTDTIRWANDMTNDNLAVGDELKILPVTGISHKVGQGDTVYTIAKRYDTDAQKIVDFPFNDFANPETFSLVAGQLVIVPDGIKPSEKPVIKRQTYIAQGPVPVAGGGFTWPLRGEVSQFFTWYHPGVDITNPIGTPLVASHNGTVTRVNIGTWDGGYGTSVTISNGAGIESHYAHLSGVNVSAGDGVTGGRTVIGWVGMTGRTTGPHVHFEIRQNGGFVNPLNYLQ